MFLQVQAEKPAVQPETVFEIGSFQMTNAMIMGVLVTVIFLIFSLIVKKKLKLVPGKLQTIAEVIVESFTNLLSQITGTRERGKKMLPLIGALFLYMGLSNLIGLIPGLTAITYNGVPLFRTPTNDFNTTFSIALAMIILTQYASMKEFGLLGHLGKYFKFKEVIQGFKKSIGEGVMAIVEFLIGLLDIVSEIAKVVSLSLRLFGNMYAGEVLMAVLFGALAVVIPSIWLGMNLLVGVLQALVFGALTAAYYTLAVERNEENNNNN